MADNVRALVIKSGTQQQIPSADSLLVGSGVDASEAGPLSIGASAADEITIGKIGITTTFPGDVDIQGSVNTVGGTTFTDDVTFQGNTTLGNGPSDTVTFAPTTTVINDIAFNGAGHRVTNMLDPSLAQDGATKAYADTKLALAGGTMSGAIAMATNKITGLGDPTLAQDAATRAFVELMGLGTKVFLCVQGGQYASLQAAVDAAAASMTANSNLGTVVLVGPKATGDWGGVTFGASHIDRNISIVGLGGSRSSKVVKVGAINFSPTGGLGNVNNNEVILHGLHITGAFGTGTAGVTFGGTTPARLRVSNCYVSNTTGGLGDGIVGNNSQANSSLYVEGCIVQIADATTGVALKHVSGYTIVKDRSEFSGGLRAVSCAAGVLEVYDSLIEMTGARETVLVSGGFMSVGYSTIKNTSEDAAAIGVKMTGGAGTVFGAGDATIALGGGAFGIGLFPGKAVDGVATSTFAYSHVTLPFSSTISTVNVSVIKRTGGKFTTALDMSSLKITSLANGTNPGDAVNFSQLSAIVSGVSNVTATAPLSSTEGATPDISLTGIIDVANGGTGVATITAGSLVVGDGANAVNEIAPGSDGDVLTVVAGAWASAAPVVTSAQGGANAIQYANASTSTDFDGDNAKFTFDEGTSIMAVAGGGSTLSVGSDSLTSTAAALDIEGASSVSASITGGATFLLTPSSVQTGFATLGALAFSLDPSLTPYKQVGALTGDISLSNAANLGPARGITIKIIGDTVSRNITSVPASWKWLGGPAPAVVEGGKTAILSIACFGSAQSDIVASWSYDGSSSVTGVGVDNQIAVWSGASSLDSSSGLTWNSATAAFAADGSAVFNDSGANRDFRVEAVGNANMLFVDASQASVSIGTTGATHTFNIGAGAAANFGVGSGGRIHTYDGSDPADGEILIGDGSVGVKNFMKTTLGAGTNIAITNGAGSITIDLTGQVAVANGGTGVSTITAGSLVVGDDANAVNEIAPGSEGDVLTVVSGAWASTAVPAATDYSVAAIITAAAVNTAVTVAGAAAIATTAAAGTARVAGIVKATDSVKVLGIQNCIVESGRAGLITQGEPVYLSASEPGKVTDLAPSTSGEVVAELGIATAADVSGLVTVLWQPKSIVVL